MKLRSFQRLNQCLPMFEKSLLYRKHHFPMLFCPFRSVLSQGPYSLHMWNFLYQNESKAYEADKLSSATNPDMSDSMAISFLLDRYNFPVVLPSGFCQLECSGSSLSGLSRTKSAFQLSATPTPRTLSKTESLCIPDDSSPADSLPRTRSFSFAKRDGFDKFRENINRYSLNLPNYLRKVNWLSRRAVDEIHWLLGTCNPTDLDLTVALELLSIDFPDLTVRKLAVQRLEKLSNDDVLKYLIQLVQVCKFP